MSALGRKPTLAFERQLWVESVHPLTYHQTMPEQHSRVLAHLLKMAGRFSGQSARPSDRIYGDLDINGGDFLEFVVEVERHFGVNLSWVSPCHGSGQPEDPTIQALAQDVIRQLA